MNFRIYWFIFLLALPGFSSAEPERKIVAFAQDTMANDFRASQVYEVRDEIAKNPRLSFIYSDAQGKVSLLIRQIEKFIHDKVDLLIVGTNDENAVVPVVSKAYQSGIPVIILDRGISGGEYTTFIKSDNEKIGNIAGRYIVNKLDGKGTVLLFEGIQTADVTKLRTKGFMDVVDDYEDISVIKRTGNFLRRDALIEMEKLIADGIHIDAIFSESDSMLSGVRMVMQRHGIDPSSVIMVGVDFITEARDAIREGRQSASILFPLGGVKTVEVATKILNGEKVPARIDIPVKLVTEANLDDVEPIF